MNSIGWCKMRISLIDRSFYLKGLMLLIRKDGEIQDEEKDMMLCVGEMLGFERKFCENTIKEILHNKYVIDEPPCFVSPDIARCFVRDGLRLSLASGEMHEAELRWLRAVAQANGVDNWFHEDSVTVSSPRGWRDLTKGLEAGCLEWE
jgi:hypothetical protein